MCDCFAKKLRDDKNRGSILMESLLAVVIMSVGITLVIQSLISGLRASQYTSDYTEAVILLENKMIEIVSKGVVESGTREEQDLTLLEHPYHFSLATESLRNQEEGGAINEIHASISWNNGKRKNKIPVETYLLKPLQ